MRELTQTVTEALLDPILARDPSGPRITYYDDATGARIELSALTLANWAAKTANLIRDEFGLTAGSRVAVLLPAHWQTAAALLGCWWAGVEVVLAPDEDAELALVPRDRVAEVAEVAEVAVLSLDPMGAPVHDLPVGLTDFATAVRTHGDRFHPGGAGVALAGLPVTEVLDRARASAARQGFTADDRVLSEGSWGTPGELIDGLLAVWSAGSSLVQVVNADPDQRERRRAAERVTMTRVLPG
ncbi:TIGR03089 family protein [Nocardia sp. BMG111209]|uniref:TIGR03089 family protein n=1 Tax=Nocardia sp. BMG111209 TaxID=1160137 RepID=UPI000379011A|nr:TIGR03089 family protein [Nocardia sp. BMG111209]